MQIHLLANGFRDKRPPAHLHIFVSVQMAHAILTKTRKRLGTAMRCWWAFLLQRRWHEACGTAADSYHRTFSQQRTMRFESTTKVLAERMLMYYRIL